MCVVNVFNRLIILLLVSALYACGSDSDEPELNVAEPVLIIDTPAASDPLPSEPDSGTGVAPADPPATDEVAEQPAVAPPVAEPPVVEPPVAETPVVEPSSGAASITDVVLITGQSNALGTETTFDPALDQPVDRFYAYTDNGWQQASLRQVWDLGGHPAIGQGDDPHNNFGFHFGKTIASQRGDRVVGIILVSAPGEGISHWDMDGFFFDKIRNKALSALNALPHKSVVDGVLWHQGETDWSVDGSNDPDLTGSLPNDYYSNKLQSLIHNFRSESWFDYGRPFICGETARSPVNARLNELNRDSDNSTACVPGQGLSTYDQDQVHFDAAGLRQLGANYAEVYLQMTN